MKCIVLVKRYTTIKIESFELEFERFVIKSMDKDKHGPSNIESGCKSPYGQCCSNYL